MRRTKDGFSDFDIDAQHSRFIKDRSQNYNPIGQALLAAGASSNGSNQGNLDTTTGALLGTLRQMPAYDGAAVTLKNDIDNNFPLKSGSAGVFGLIQKCEAVTTADCDTIPWGDSTFTKNCGVCLTLGTNSQGQSAVGGMLLLPGDAELAEGQVAGTTLLPQYNPTLGTCPAGTMVRTRAQCVKVQAQLVCAKNANFDATPGCSQCYSDGSYFPIDPASGKITGTITVIGSGVVAFSEGGYPTVTKKLSMTPTIFNLQGGEGTRLVFKILPCNDRYFPPTTPPSAITCTAAEKLMPVSFAGILSGITVNGTMDVDLSRVIQVDTTTNRRPLTKGATAVSTVDVRMMAPGFGYTTMEVVGFNPFTFMDTSSEEAQRCQATAYITKPESAALVESDPCYTRGSGPGRFTLDCLQSAFTSNGCDSSGKGYPSTSASASSLMRNSSGSFRKLNDISDFIYSQALSTATGLDMAGNQLSIPDWSSASEFCTGLTITSPCDTVNKNTGPLSRDCLNYLWQNKGENQRIGATYSPIAMANSLFSSGPTRQFCQSTGTLSPVLPNGRDNLAAIAYWQEVGGVEAVKAEMRQINNDANSNLADEYKQTQLLQCFGSTLAPRPTGTKSSSGCGAQCGTRLQKVRLRQTGDGNLQVGQIAIYDSTGKNVAIGATVTGTAPFSTYALSHVNDGNLFPRVGYFSGRKGPDSPNPYGDCNLTIDLGGMTDVIAIVYYSTTAGVFQNWSMGIVMDTLDGSNNKVDSRKITVAQNYTVFDYRLPNQDPSCMRCSVPSGKQVFWVAEKRVDTPGYNVEYNQSRQGAAGMCATFGAVVATSGQIENAKKAGLDTCISAWVNNGGQIINLVPTASATCDISTNQPGNIPPVSDGNSSGTWCYGVRPIGDGTDYGGAYRTVPMVPTNPYRKWYVRSFGPGTYTGPVDMPGNSI
jgi:hypothetical protein